MRTQLPRLMLAAPMSGSGKTTISAGLIAAYAARGLAVAPFKCGPDYIDPSYHALAAGRACHNLDAWLLPPERISGIVARRATGAGLALIEGVMGLFDGYAGDDDTGSSAHIARLTQTPVVLVLDVRAMARTAAALIQGLRDFDPRVQVAGVILNRAGSPRHAQLVRSAIEGSTGLPVLGWLARDEQITLPERHLGLVPTAEPGRWQAWLADVRARVEAGVDLDRLLALAEAAPPLWQEAGTRGQGAGDKGQGAGDKGQGAGTRSQGPGARDQEPGTRSQGPEARETGPRSPTPEPSPLSPVIAVAADEAFSFRYDDNLDLLRDAGATIVPFSPLRDKLLPAGVQALYLCGGFPELYAAQLSTNQELRVQIKAAAAAGMPIYAECGGLMYLTESVTDAAGATHPMAGVLPGRSVMSRRLTLGYRTVQATRDSWLWRAGERVRGHEFHYSVWQERPSTLPALYDCLPDTFRSETRPEGAHTGNVLASYVHLHFLACPQIAARFVAAAAAYSAESRR